MDCLICGSLCRPFLVKQFSRCGLDKVHYSRCSHCGFVISDTHAEMSNSEWELLNHEFHSGYQGLDFNPDDPGWIERLHAQAEAIAAVASVGLIEPGRWLDYACGDGKLSDYLEGRAANTLCKYDAYMAAPGYLSEADLAAQAYQLVITTSVFEHLRDRRDFDRINGLVASRGVMSLHTLVCEEVPQDPDWFYFLPVHCAFHTNKSMSILLEQWGYKSSIYHLESRLWFLFRDSYSEIAAGFERLKREFSSATTNVWFGKSGFMDYWKQSEYVICGGARRSKKSDSNETLLKTRRR